MTKNKRATGKRGEDIACRFLKKDSYKILQKNFRCHQGEIDLIAKDKDGVLCFVEVKARNSEDFGLPEESITYWKRKKLLYIALAYIEVKKLKSKAMRFDVVSINLANNKTTIIKNAFDVND